MPRLVDLKLGQHFAPCFWYIHARVLNVASHRLTTRLELKDTSPLCFQFHVVSAETHKFVCTEKKKCMESRTTSSKLNRHLNGDNYFGVRALFISHIPQKTCWHHCHPQPASSIVFRQPLQKQLCIIKPAVRSTSGILTLLTARSEILF